MAQVGALMNCLWSAAKPGVEPKADEDAMNQRDDIQVTVLQLLHRLIPGLCCIAVPSRERRSWTITHPELLAEILEMEEGTAFVAVLRRTGEIIENSEARNLDDALVRIGELMRTFSVAQAPSPLAAGRRAA